MCYNDCEHFRFNPMTGEDRCVAKNRDICPELEDEENEEEDVDTA